MASAAQKLDYSKVDDRNIFLLIQKSREGLKYAAFHQIQKDIPLRNEDWSKILHLSERTLQRYKKEKIDFGPHYAERIIEVQLLFNKGISLFGSKENFITWLQARNISLGGENPLSLLDNTFGIMLLKNELTRIEHGVLA